MAEGASIGSVSITVNPDASAFWSKFQAQAGAGASRAGDQLGAAVGKGIQDKIASGMVDGIQRGARSAQTSAAKAGDDAGGKFADLFRKRVEAALKSLPDAKIGADTSEADRRITEIRARLAELSGRSIGVNLDAGAALAEISALQGELRDLGAQSPNVQVRADVAAAAGQLAAFGAEVGRLDGRQVDVQVDADTAAAQAQLAAVGAASLGSVGGIQALIAAGIAIGPAIVPAAAAAVAALGAIGPAAAVGGAGIGVLALGIVPVIGAVKAMGAAQDAAGKSAASSAGKQGQLAGAIDGVRSAQASLANTTANAAEANRRAEQRVTDAVRSETTAQQGLLRAQQAINDAREAARRSLEDLANRQADLALDQRKSALDITKAEQDLAKARATAAKAPTAGNQRAVAEAQLALDEQIQRSKELSTEQKRLAADKAQADKAGIDGSKQVVAAQDAITAAQEKVRASQQATADARHQQDETARQGAFSVTQAQQGVVNAQRAVQSASVSAGGAGSAAMTKLQQAMAGLSPAGQAFAKFLFGLKGQFADLSKTAQEGLLPGLQAFIVALLPLMPQVNTLIGILAQTMGDLFRQAGPVVAEILPPFLTMLGQVGPPIMEAFAKILLNVGKGFGGIIEAFAPFAVQFFQGLGDLSTKFADFGTGLANSPGFHRFIDYVNENGPKLWKILENIATFLGNLVVALAPFGSLVLDGLVWLTDQITKLSTTDLQIISVGIIGIAVAIGIFNAAMAIAALNPVTLIIIGIGALIAAVALAYVHFKTFRDIVDAVWHGIVDASLWAWNTVLKPTFEALRAFFVDVLAPAAVWLWQNVLVPVWQGISAAVSAAWSGVILPVLTAIWGFIQNVLAPLFLWLWGHVIVPAWDGIKLAIEIAWAIIQVIFGLIVIFIKAVLAPIFTWLWHNVIEPVWGGIAAAISWTWDNVLKPVFSALGGFIRDSVVPAFKTAVDAIGRAWDGLRDLARKPVEFIVKQVINPLIRGYDGLAKTFGAPHVDEIPGFAYGGFVSGPGGPRDDKIPAWLSNGEYVIPAGVVARHGVGFFDRLTGNTSAGGAGSGSFADGGIVGFFKDVWSGLSDPIGLLRKPAEALLKSIPGGDAVRTMLTGMGHKLIDGILHFVTGHAGAIQGPAGKANPAAIGAPGGNSIEAIIRLAAMSGLPYSVTSTYRPGDPGYHGRGMAVDFGDFQYGAAANNRLAAYFMRAAPDLLELIHSPGFYVKNGQQVGPGYYGSATVAAHYNHVHVAATPGGAALAVSLLGGGGPSKGLADGGLVGTATYDSGGFLPPGLTLAYNGTGSPETIRTADQEAALRRGGATITQHIYPQRGQSEPEIAAAASRQLAWELR